MIKLNVTFSKPNKPLGKLELQRAIDALNKLVMHDDCIINLNVIDQSKVRELNKKYAGKDQATDVLSFRYDDEADVVISAQHIKSQARAAGTDETTEFVLLAVHGILHAIGYDHQNQRQIVELDDIQRTVMDKAGLEYRNFGWQL